MIHSAFPSWYATVIVRRSWSHKYLERMTHLHLQNPCVCLSCSEIDGHSNPAFQRVVQRALRMTYTRGRRSRAWCIIGAAAILFLWRKSPFPFWARKESKVTIKAFLVLASCLNLHKMTSCILFFLQDWPDGLNSVQKHPISLLLKRKNCLQWKQPRFKVNWT